MCNTGPAGDRLGLKHNNEDVRGFAKNFFLQKSEITMEVGGWVGPGLSEFFFGKIVPK